MKNKCHKKSQKVWTVPFHQGSKQAIINGINLNQCLHCLQAALYGSKCLTRRNYQLHNAWMDHLYHRLGVKYQYLQLFITNNNYVYQC